MKSCLLLLAAQFDGRVLLTLEEVCDAIAIQKQTAYNRLSTGTFPIPMRKEGRNLVGDIRDVVEYLDSQRAVAKQEHEKMKNLIRHDEMAPRMRARAT
ncbi:helix-turn-helix transcriptional regulator [Ralstonia thomasii]|jgi:predicted DNA-binding transcriptional regulator AlpA